MDTYWVLLDTAVSTNGEVAEIAAQRMFGWDEDGESFYVRIADSDDDVVGAIPAEHAYRSFVQYVGRSGRLA